MPHVEIAQTVSACGLIEELGRLLGEALVLRYQRDTKLMVNSPTGTAHE
jgi:hypothetical protein